MRETVAKLMKAQELELVIQESDILHKNDAAQDIRTLQTQIGELLDDVPPEHRQRYLKLRTAGLAVVNESGGICLGCRTSIPKGDLNRMYSGKTPWMCPHCGRFALLSEQGKQK